MKKIMILLLAIGFFAACTTNEPVRYASSSPEIDTVKKLLQSYLEQDWDSYKLYYVDTAKVHWNVPQNQGVSFNQIIEANKETFSMFSNIRFAPDHDFFEMVITDEGEKWVNFWGVWEATLNANGQRFEMPLHLTIQFIDGKVVVEHAYYDVSQMALVLGALPAQSE